MGRGGEYDDKARMTQGRGSFRLRPSFLPSFRSCSPSALPTSIPPHPFINPAITPTPRAHVHLPPPSCYSVTCSAKFQHIQPNSRAISSRIDSTTHIFLHSGFGNNKPLLAHRFLPPAPLTSPQSGTHPVHKFQE